jgi:septal ring factor EnvC (AmiA/AmiB activator)
MTDIFGDTTRKELQQQIDRLRAELAALKAQRDPLEEMWRELAEYQPMADRDGHGESWSRMCRERTATAAWQSFQSTPELSFEHARDGARLAREAIFFRRESARYSDRAIAAIRRAKEVRP